MIKRLCVSKKNTNFVGKERIIMKLKRKELLYQEAGKYFLDLSKLVFGGVILAEIMNLGFNDTAMLTVGGFIVVSFALVGFRYYSNSKR